MRLWLQKLLLVILLCGWCCAAWADGGAVRLVEQHGSWRISVFTSPTPVRAGVVDIGVLVQDAETSQPASDVRIVVRTVPHGHRGRAIETLASSAAATNKLLQAALVELPESGTWDVEVTCTRSGERAEVTFALEAGEALPEWLSVWPWFTWPLGVVLLFGIHQHLVHRRQRSFGMRC